MLQFIELPINPTEQTLTVFLVITVFLLMGLGALSISLLKSHFAKLKEERLKAVEDNDINRKALENNTKALNELTFNIKVINEKIIPIEKRLDEISSTLNEHHDALNILVREHNSLYPEGCITAINMNKKKRTKNEKT